MTTRYRDVAAMVLIIATAALVPMRAEAQLVYGGEIHVQNKYASWGSFLDTNNQGCQGNKYCVSASQSRDRAPGQGTGTWRIVSATGKPNGEPVLYGDEVHIQNKHGNWGSYLDTNSTGCQGNKYCVSASQSRDRAPGQGTGTWRLVSARGKAAGQQVMFGEEIHMQNKYADWGSYLDTNGTGCQGNKYCVSASAARDRAGAGTGIWRVLRRVSSLPRATTDRPDDVTGSQIKLYYVVPKDGIDNHYDTRGQIATQVAVADVWTSEQVNRVFRYDTSNGALDIQFVRLDKSQAELKAEEDSRVAAYNAAHPNQPTSFNKQVAISREMTRLGVMKPGAAHAIFYDGTNLNGDCQSFGGGLVTTLVLKQSEANAAPANWRECGYMPLQVMDGPFRRSNQEGTVASTLVHEVFHSVGVVPSCAPDVEGTMHLRPISSDIMAFNGTGYTAYTLDPKRDQYYGHGRLTCADLAESGIWADTSPTAVLTPTDSGVTESGVNGRNVVRAAHAGGKFEQAGGGTWKEYNLRGQATFTFRETQRDDWSVYLTDDSRNVQIQIDIHRKMITYGEDGGPRRDLYPITVAWRRT